MQQIHRALLEQAAGTWPLIFGKGSKRIRTCDHDVNGNTFSELAEFRDAPMRQEIYNIAARSDDVELIRQLPILDNHWCPYEIPDKCGKSVVEFLFDRLDPETQLVQAILHRKLDLLPKLLSRPIRLHEVGRILSIRDDVEIRQWILSAGFVEDPRLMFIHNLSIESVQWLLDEGVHFRNFSLRQLWGTDRFGEVPKWRIGKLCNFTDCGVDVVLDLKTRFPHWISLQTLANFIWDGNEAAVNILWKDHFKDIAKFSYLFDLNTTKWILSLCDQQQLKCLQQKWYCHDFEVAKFLHARGFVVLSYPFGIDCKNGSRLVELELDEIVKLRESVPIAVLDELRTLGYCRFELLFPNGTFRVPIIQWLAEQSGLPRKIRLNGPTSKQQLEWIHSHYVPGKSIACWKIKK